jgi:hypothetical protein
MARDYAEYLRRGATIAAVVIDAPGQNAAMVEKLALPFPVLSDPDGTGAVRPWGVWDDEEKMALPALLVIAPDGTEAYRYTGVDFMDRPDDGDVLGALDARRLPPIQAPIQTAPHLPPAPGPRAMPLADLAVYMRGVRFATQALGKRARDPWHQQEAERSARMAERYVAAQGATRRVTSGER